MASQSRTGSHRPQSSTLTYHSSSQGFLLASSSNSSYLRQSEVSSSQSRTAVPSLPSQTVSLGSQLSSQAFSPGTASLKMNAELKPVEPSIKEPDPDDDTAQTTRYQSNHVEGLNPPEEDQNGIRVGKVKDQLSRQQEEKVKVTYKTERRIQALGWKSNITVMNVRPDVFGSPIGPNSIMDQSQPFLVGAGIGAFSPEVVLLKLGQAVSGAPSGEDSNPQGIQLLTSPNDDVREQAVRALGNIAGDVPTCRDLILGQIEADGEILYHTVYNGRDRMTDHNKDFKVETPAGDSSLYTRPDKPKHDVWKALKLFIDAGAGPAGRLTYRGELVDLTRQSLSKLANPIYINAIVGDTHPCPQDSDILKLVADRLRDTSLLMTRCTLERLKEVHSVDGSISILDMEIVSDLAIEMTKGFPFDPFVLPRDVVVCSQNAAEDGILSLDSIIVVMEANLGSSLDKILTAVTEPNQPAMEKWAEQNDIGGEVDALGGSPKVKEAMMKIHAQKLKAQKSVKYWEGRGARMKRKGKIMADSYHPP
ncbi:unnamed protein product [Cuscuta europaea]|uniref:Alpha-N-acetylglucosaminidase C-terminal domain-containing protein n=1 Tax=Cuscuta europaea TaxID=41803 RepID=A0A9P1E3F1_CUSEU|nr:unnamed protein product [Cuscuta europaea]